MKARDYQLEMVASVIREFRRVRSTLALMATGTGKTNCAGEFINQWKAIDRRRVLFLAHRDELIQQAAARFRKMCPEDAVEIEQGEDYKASRRRTSKFWDIPRIVVASKDTLWRRLDSFDRDEFGLVITDECHHAVDANKTYSRISDYFSDAKHLGITATADRTDGASLGETFETVSYVYGIQQAVQDGWLVPIVQQFVQVDGYDLSRLRRSKGDLDERELDRILMQEKILHGMVVPTIELANSRDQRRQVIGFANSVAQAVELAAIFNRYQPNSAAAIHGAMATDVRRSITSRYLRGELQYLMNMSVATEGFDAPETRVVMLGRPTLSRLLYEQMIGRGTRTSATIIAALAEAPDAATRRAIIRASCKPSVLVIDMVGISGQHKLVTVADILGGGYSEDIRARAKKKAEARGGRGDVTLDLEEARREAEEEKRKQQVKVGVEYTTEYVDPFGGPVEVEPQWAGGREVTDSHMKVLRQAKVPERELKELTFWQARNLVLAIDDRRRLGLCTMAQFRLLAKHGVDAKKMTFDAAKELIDRIAANGWCLPEGVLA